MLCRVGSSPETAARTATIFPAPTSPVITPIRRSATHQPIRATASPWLACGAGSPMRGRGRVWVNPKRPWRRSIIIAPARPGRGAVRVGQDRARPARCRAGPGGRPSGRVRPGEPHRAAGRSRSPWPAVGRGCFRSGLGVGVATNLVRDCRSGRYTGRPFEIASRRPRPAPRRRGTAYVARTRSGNRGDRVRPRRPGRPGQHRVPRPVPDTSLTASTRSVNRRNQPRTVSAAIRRCPNR
jgi:hypothetical protein